MLFNRTYRLINFLLISLALNSCTIDEMVLTPTEEQSFSKILGYDNNLVVLKVIQNWSIPRSYGVDRMLSSGPLEIPTNGTCLGQFAYGLEYYDGTTATSQLYRMYNSSSYDHMISINPTNEPLSWSLEAGNVSSIWTGTTNCSGLTQLQRSTNIETGDRDAHFNGSTYPTGYSFDGNMGYAFQRFGNLREVLESFNIGETQLVANKVAGGIIWELTKAGKQFLNHWSGDLAGRGMQMDCYVKYDTWTNPTEGGDGVGTSLGLTTNWCHGSPLINFNKTSSTLETEVYPLLWNPSNYLNSLDSTNRAVMWKGKFYKKIEGVSIGAVGINPPSTIIKWTSKMTLPSATPDSFLAEIVCAHLNNEFNKFYSFDSFTSTFEDITSGLLPSSLDQHILVNGSSHNYTGMIISTTDGNYALGCYQRVATSADEGWSLVNYTISGQNLGEDDIHCSKWGLLIKNRNGEHEFTKPAYIIPGTLQYVREIISYLNGLTSLP